MPRSLTVLSLLLVAASAADAQGTLSTQGFGYPLGGLSVRALGAAGAIAETDPQSLVNPAALAEWGRTALVFSFAPEFRRVTAGDVSDRSSVSRFPVIAAAVPVGSRAVVGISSATFLDRSYETEFQSTDIVGGVPVTSTVNFRSLGAMNDVRLGAAYTIAPSLRAGLGIHAITGENRTRVQRRETEGSPSAPYTETDRVSYGGSAVSAGVEWRPSSVLTFAVSGRKGFGLRSEFNEESATEADVPDRVGAGVVYGGISDVRLAARAEWVGWSALEALGNQDQAVPVQATDAVEVGLGAEFSGPSAFGRVLPLRVGVRRRGLPFSRGQATPDGPIYEEVEETAVAGGLAIPFAANRALIDIALQRAFRSSGDIRERAWTLGFALTVRP